MKATELRIGNWCSVYGTNGLKDGWKEQAIIFPNIGVCCSHPEWFNPIPLTDEWLTRLGFTASVFKDNFYIDIHRYKAFVYYHRVGKINIRDTSDTNFVYPINIEYVHQMQNLYFALTGQELTVTK